MEATIKMILKYFFFCKLKICQFFFHLYFFISIKSITWRLSMHEVLEMRSFIYAYLMDSFIMMIEYVRNKGGRVKGWNEDTKDSKSWLLFCLSPTPPSILWISFYNLTHTHTHTHVFIFFGHNYDTYSIIKQSRRSALHHSYVDK